MAVRTHDLRCTFETRTEVSDGGGGVEVVWAVQFAKWGALAFAPLASQLETIQQGELTVATRGTLTVREDLDTRTIRPDWRVRITEDGHRDRIWQIGEIQRPSRGCIRLRVEAS